MENKIIFIRGANWPYMYYTDTEGTLCVSHNEDELMDFLEDTGLIEKIKVLEVHPDICYNEHGCSYKIEDNLPECGDDFDDIPTWVYSKNTDKPLIEQLTEEERIEFDEYNNNNNAE